MRDAQVSIWCCVMQFQGLEERTGREGTREFRAGDMGVGGRGGWTPPEEAEWEGVRGGGGRLEGGGERCDERSEPQKGLG